MNPILINLGIFLLGCASWALTEYCLNRTDECATAAGENLWMLVLCGGSMALIVASSLLVDVTHDWRMVVCPGTQFICCLVREARAQWRQHQRWREQLQRDLDAIREGVVNGDVGIHAPDLQPPVTRSKLK